MEQKTVDVKIWKSNENAVIPTYAKPGDAGMDLVAVGYEYRGDIDCFVYHTGIHVAIPEGYVGLVYPRSSNRNTDLYMTNSVGIIDSGYRGEILVCFKDRDSVEVIDNINSIESAKSKANRDIIYKVGDRIAQLMIVPYPKVNFVQVNKEDLGETERGDGGHGSTGK